ncbi:MAG: hypothetical protein A2579_00015 [Lysobacterales bacterium RIFOXYD1_FULL_69_11]|nr:MAG: hypothetical protein A2190_13625 [Xanthomonadales bacterium RIFOXYA1_FULL_69_10]OHE87113.1 MAG: hypothetical protein A2579_00015 [Xanthomonadales bacterium RIFOXYD1_FULL_69_11]
MRHALPIAVLLTLSLAACSGDRAGSSDTVADVAAPPAMDSAPIVDQPSVDIPPATAPTPVPPVADGTFDARMDGVAEARFGMTADEVRAVWDGELEGNPAEGEECFHLSPAGQSTPAQFALMFGDGRLVRYSAESPDRVAPGGGRRGMAADDIRAMYDGRVEASPHKYTEGQYLRVTGQDGSPAVIVFETDADGAVTEWRVGLAPYVDYVEGCA